MVHDDVDTARRDIHQKWSHPDRGDVADDVSPQVHTAFFEMHDMLRIEEMAHHEYGAYEHRDHGRDSRSLDAQTESENENRIEDHVQYDTDQDRIHRFLRVSRSAHHAAETVAYVGQYTARNDDFQVVDRIGDGLFAASESDQDFGQVDHRDGDEYGREDKCQNESVAQNVTGPFDIFHPQYDRQPGGCSYAD